MRVTLNLEQSLYVIDVGRGFTCLGFKVCQERTRDIARELGHIELAPTAYASVGAYEQYERALNAARTHAARTGRPLQCQLTPELIGLEYQRVEVVDRYGGARAFVVGRSTGFIPVHLELPSRRARGGVSVWGAPFRAVRRVSSRRVRGPLIPRSDQHLAGACA